jgi:hypothetical protein
MQVNIALSLLENIGEPIVFWSSTNTFLSMAEIIFYNHHSNFYINQYFPASL